MNKDEIIELLKEQNSHYKALVDSLLAQVKELTEEVSSLKEALLRKNESLAMERPWTSCNGQVSLWACSGRMAEPFTESLPSA